jgi:enoyl-CoA hydratase
MPLSPSHPPVVTVDDLGIARVTVHGQGALNIVGSAELLAITQAVHNLAAREDIKALILRGHGERALIGGANIHEMAQFDRTSAEAFIRRLRDVCEAMRRFPAPVIARMPGWCLGGGLELAMACDLRVASADAQFGMPEVKVGIPSIIHAALMPRLIGQARARWLLLTGEHIDAATALAWGLVDRVVSQAELDTEVERLASGFAAMGANVLRQQKRLLREWEDQGLDVAVNNSVAEFGAAFETGEPQTYMGAFLARKNT